MTTLSHIDPDNRPTMVDVTHKSATARTATAQAIIRLPANVASALADTSYRTPKGPVFDTAIIAGVMAAKRTHELIPFCHPLGIENCKIDIQANGTNELLVRCTVSVTHKTGVEMEALTGATVAALTVYDMCKALSHDIVIAEVKLLEKRGGKSDVPSP
jgi:cyclic pyranopterin phosphate synthase